MEFSADNLSHNHLTITYFKIEDFFAMENKINVTLYTVPQEACDSQKMSWCDVAGMVEEQLSRSFNDNIKFGHVEFMDQKWFDDERAQALLESGEVNFPFVLVNGEIACADKKVNLPKIKRVIHQNKLS